ncbi:MAG: macro domain-containing protein [Myxococcales bacterium]|nr:macro domain-containing protein [Myxococcales bacterium]
MVASQLGAAERAPIERIAIVEADITTMRVDALVSPANRQLVPGGGAERAIHDAPGPELFAACQFLGGCNTGDARITRGYGLKAPWVIHAVGPVWQGGGHGEEELLALCYARVLEIAGQHRLRTIALPLLSSGLRGYPVDTAARVAVSALTKGLSAARLPERIVLCAFTGDASAALRTAWNERANRSGVRRAGGDRHP